ncbi:MAG: SPASM domain-containing protein, partial [Clostridia bacterium]|nr:SPASM domain-containing protein [Clostridia bacterium]
AQGGYITKILHSKTEVASNRALQFLGTNGSIYSCSAARSLITVDEFGNVMPCRRMPIICGNVFESTLAEVYYHNDVFKNLRGDRIPTECENCKYSYLCKGGAGCQSYAVYGRFDKADPSCPLAQGGRD